MIEIILSVFGGVFFLISAYGLIKILTTARKRLLDMVDGDIFAYISLVAWIIVFMATSAFWIFSSIDFYAAKSFRKYLHSFPETYLFEGALCLLLTYGASKLKTFKSDGQRLLVIIGGIFFGLLAIFLGLSKMIDD